MRLTKPKKPTPYSRLNWPTYGAWEQATRIYEGAMAIYIAMGGKS